MDRFKLVELAIGNVCGYKSSILADAGLLGNAVPWREQCKRVILSFYPESIFVARVWEVSDGIGFQIHHHGQIPQLGEIENEEILSISSLCYLLDNERLKSLTASCAIRALDLAGYANVEDMHEYGGRFPYITTTQGTILAIEDRVIIGTEADQYLKDMEKCLDAIEDAESGSLKTVKNSN